MSLTPLPPRESAVDGCAHAVKDAILRGELIPGERLPPERRLAAQLGVSRLTLRAGLAKVAAGGLLAVRQGSGYLVRDFREHGGAELLPGLIELAARGDRLALIRDLLLMRRLVARAALERIAELDDPGAVERVGAAIEDFAAQVTRGTDLVDLAEADLRVVSALLAETRSAVLRLCLNPISAVLRDLPELRAAMYRSPRENLDGYRLLVGWLTVRSREHVELILSELERRDRATCEHLAASPARPHRRSRGASR